MTFKMHHPQIHDHALGIVTHDMPCAVCWQEKAVHVSGAGQTRHFAPCWKCQDGGWSLAHKPRTFMQRCFAKFYRKSENSPTSDNDRQPVTEEHWERIKRHSRSEFLERNRLAKMYANYCLDLCAALKTAREGHIEAERAAFDKRDELREVLVKLIAKEAECEALWAHLRRFAQALNDECDDAQVNDQILRVPYAVAEKFLPGDGNYLDEDKLRAALSSSEGLTGKDLLQVEGEGSSPGIPDKSTAGDVRDAN